MSALADYTLPTAEEEVWRYSRIAELDLEAYHPAADPAATNGIPAPLEAALATVPVRGVTVVAVNGRVVHVDVHAPGVEVSTDDRDALGTAMTETTDVFAAMNGDFVTEPVVIRVAHGATIEAPIVVAHWIDEPNVAAFPR